MKYYYRKPTAVTCRLDDPLVALWSDYPSSVGFDSLMAQSQQK
jgi:hypothetical protein